MSTAVTPRMGRVLEQMEQKGIDIILLAPSSGFRYVMGQSPVADERLFVLALAPGKEPFMVCNELYQIDAGQMFDGPAILWKDGEDPYPILRRELEARHWPINGRIAVEQDTRARFLLPMMATLPEATFCSASPILDAMRVYKDEEERERMREACRRGDEGMKRAIQDGSAWVGKTEADFCARISYEMTSLDLLDVGGGACVGENAAAPHYTGRKGVIRRGSCLLVDYAGAYRNYYTDMTRTFWFGKPDPEFVKIHDIVREANAAARDAAVLGRELQEVDRAARRVITEAGYGKYFTHRTGHGIGINEHESPNAAEGETAILKPGMAFSIEPGIYLPGRFGVRIEDLALMTENGVEILHHYPRDFASCCYD